MMLQDLAPGSIIIESVGNGYVIRQLSGVGSLGEVHVAIRDDGGKHLFEVIKGLIVKDLITS